MTKLQIRKTEAILIFLVLCVGFYSFYNDIETSIYKPPKITGNVYVFIETPEGKELIVSNTITDIGEKYLRDWASGANATHYIWKYISLGNSSVAQTKTKLDTEATTTGFIRAEGSIVYWVYSGDYAFNVTKKFTATGNIAINCAGCHTSVTSESNNNMVSLASLGGTQAFQSNWNCTIVWMFVFNAN